MKIEDLELFENEYKGFFIRWKQDGKLREIPGGVLPIEHTREVFDMVNRIMQVVSGKIN